jgi:hypothetical protein
MTPAAIMAAMASVIILRTLAVRFDWRSYRLGDHSTATPILADRAVPPLAPVEKAAPVVLRP